MVDGGNFGESPSGPAGWKAPALLKAMHQIGYDAISLGPRDLSPALTDSLAKWKAREVMLSSLHESKTRMKLPATRIIARSGFKLGLVSVVSTAYNRLENGLAYEVGPFLREQLEHLRRKKADVVAVIYLGPAQELAALSRQYPEVDLWLQAEGNHRPISLLDSAGNALVVSAGDRGREIAFVTVEKEKKGDRLMASFQQLILNDRIPDAPRAQAIIQAVRNSGRPPQPAPKTGASSSGSSSLLNPYLGSLACQRCHEQIFGSWQNTRHAHAFQSLVAKGEDKNLSCLECHTVGYREETGYAATAATAHLVEVGCETCHGRGGFHVRMNGRIANFAKVTDTTCRRCHTSKTSPAFNYAEAVARVH